MLDTPNAQSLLILMAIVIPCIIAASGVLWCACKIGSIAPENGDPEQDRCGDGGDENEDEFDSDYGRYGLTYYAPGNSEV